MITVEGLRAEVRREMKLSVGLRCQMSKFLEDKSKESKEDAVALAAIVFDPTLPITGTIKVLQRHGYTKKLESVRRHRLTRCVHCESLMKRLKESD